MNAPTKYVLNLIAILVTLVLSTVTIFGWNNFVEAVGGLKSFGGLIALTVMAMVLLGTIVWLQLHDYTDNNVAMVRDALVAFLVIVVLGAIGWNWIDLPSGAGVKVLAALVISAIAAMITTWLGYVDE